MGNRASSGFTIIEVILFLAVTGALIAGMMVATSSTMGVQRYRDATESFKTLLQEQYADLTSVQNARNNALACNTEANVTTGDVLRGQSDCVLMGKYMVIRNGDVAIYPVLGWNDPAAALAADDIQSLRDDFRINLDKSNVEELQLEWDARISWITTGTATNPDDSGSPVDDRSIAILFIRAPTSGQIYTFTSNDVPTDIQIDSATAAPPFIRSMIAAGAVVPGQKARVICLDSAGITPIPNTSIYIAPYASGPSSVEVRSNAVAEQLGAPERC